MRASTSDLLHNLPDSLGREPEGQVGVTGLGGLQSVDHGPLVHAKTSESCRVLGRATKDRGRGGHSVATLGEKRVRVELDDAAPSTMEWAPIAAVVLDQGTDAREPLLQVRWAKVVVVPQEVVDGMFQPQLAPLGDSGQFRGDPSQILSRGRLPILEWAHAISLSEGENRRGSCAPAASAEARHPSLRGNEARVRARRGGPVRG